MSFKSKYIVIFIITILLSSFANAKNFTLHSNDINGQISINQVFNGFGCSGKNISPSLSWSDAPKDTKSFAITIYDPDAPTGSGWWHWVVFDIPKNVLSIQKGASNLKLLPKKVIQSKTDFGTNEFGGACPPKGDKAHRYIITVHALNTEKLGLDKNANPALVGFMINGHTIQKSSLISYYQR